MAFLQRLKAWGAVEKNGRRLRMINVSILSGFLVGFGLLDALLPWLQHRHPMSVQEAACALRWINILTVHFMPAPIRDYVAWHCVASEISIPTIARIYAMLKITLAFPLIIICDTIYILLIFSKDKTSIKYLYSDLNWKLDQVFFKSEIKLVLKSILLLPASVFLFL